MTPPASDGVEPVECKMVSSKNLRENVARLEYDEEAMDVELPERLVSINNGPNSENNLLTPPASEGSVVQSEATAISTISSERLDSVESHPTMMSVADAQVVAPVVQTPAQPVPSCQVSMDRAFLSPALQALIWSRQQAFQGQISSAFLETIAQTAVLAIQPSEPPLRQAKRPLEEVVVQEELASSESLLLSSDTFDRSSIRPESKKIKTEQVPPEAKPRPSGEPEVWASVCLLICSWKTR